MTLFIPDPTYSTSSAPTPRTWLDSQYIPPAGWTWLSTGEAILGGYQHFGPTTDPSSPPLTGRDCLMMQLKDVEFGLWRQWMCTYPGPYLCE